MKVLVPTEYYPPFTVGGAEISTKLFAEGLAKKGPEVHILTPNYGSFSDTSFKEHGTYIHKFKSLRRFLFRKRGISQKMYQKNRPLFYLALNRYIRFSATEFRKKICGLHLKENFDIVHAQNLESIIGLDMAKVDCLKIAHIRDFSMFCIHGGKMINGKLCRKCSMKNIQTCLDTNRLAARLIRRDINWRKSHLGGFDHYVTVSKFVANELEKEGVQRERISVIYNPLTRDQVSRLSKERARGLLNLNYHNIVLFVGALIEAKGAHLIPKLAKKMPNINFVIVGDGPLRKFFENCKIKNIHYRGFLAYEKIKHYYRAADVLLVPSLWYEPFGRIVIEGAANGCYLIGSDRGAIPELMNVIKWGVSVAPTLPNLKNALEFFMLKHPKTRANIARFCLDRMGERPIDSLYKAYRGLLRD